MALDEATNPMQGVSGPGKFAKRTDLSYQSENYGDGVAYDAAKSGAPLAKAQKSPMLSEAPQVSAEPAIGLYDKSTRPDEPITHGIDVGAGAGSDALMMRSKFAEVKLSETLAQMLPYDTTGEIGILYQRAVARGM
jgi:hypothetical protein